MLFLLMLLELLIFFIDNIYVEFGIRVYQQTIGIQMGTIA